MAATPMTNLGVNRARASGVVIPSKGMITIGFANDPAANYTLPANFPNGPDPLAEADGLSLQQILGVEIRPTAANAANTAPVLWIARVAGPPVEIQITNNDQANASPTLEIDIIYLHSLVR